MALHIIAGSGPVGTAVAAELLDRGDQVRVVTRSGTGPDGVEKVALDVTDRDAFAAQCADAAVIYNCVNPPYDQWPATWPPIAESLLHAAERSGAVLAITGNLYPLGRPEGPMTEAAPDRPISVKGGVRAQMWQQALEAYQAGRITGALELRASDYVGVGPSLMTMLVLDKLTQGKKATVPADLDAPHTWSNPSDEGRMLARIALDERAWGHTWHLPSAPAVSLRELVALAATQCGITDYKLGSMPLAALRAAGLFNSMAKEFAEMNYQFRVPFVLDAGHTSAMFGGEPTPLAESVAQNLRWGGYLPA